MGNTYCQVIDGVWTSLAREEKPVSRECLQELEGKVHQEDCSRGCALLSGTAQEQGG